MFTKSVHSYLFALSSCQLQSLVENDVQFQLKTQKEHFLFCYYKKMTSRDMQGKLIRILVLYLLTIWQTIYSSIYMGPHYVELGFDKKQWYATKEVQIFKYVYTEYF